MCYQYYYKHTCGHEKAGEFYLCTKHKGKDKYQVCSHHQNQEKVLQ